MSRPAVMPGGGSDRAHPVRRWWQTQSHYTAIEQTCTRFRKDDQRREQFRLLADGQGKDFQRLALPHSSSIVPWRTAD